MDTFELWCWKRLLRVPWTTGSSNQSILSEISPEYSLQYFGYLRRRTESFEKTLMLGKIKSGRSRGQQGMRWHYWLDRHEFEQAPGVGDGWEGLACCSPWGHKELDTTEQLNWTELNWSILMSKSVLILFFIIFIYVYSFVWYICIYMCVYIFRSCEVLCVWVKVLVTQLCPTLCEHMDCSPPSSSVHGIL